MIAKSLVLFLFIILEIFSYGNSLSIQIGITCIEYLFILFQFFYNRSNGVFYYIAFTILGIKFFGGEKTGATMMFNYLRLGPVSLNLLVSVLLAVICSYEKKISLNSFIRNDTYKFISYYIAYGFVVGLFYLIIGHNYLDFFVSDCLTYMPFFICVILVNSQHISDTKQLLLLTLPYTILLYILAICFNKIQIYGGSEFAVDNTFSFFAIVSLFLFRKRYNKCLYALMMLTIIYLIANSFIFLSGKFWIILLGSFVLLSIKYAKKNVIVLLPLIMFIYWGEDIMNWGISYFTGNIISFKVSQILYIFQNVNDLTASSGEFSSIGNIITETITIIKEMGLNLNFSLFGYGFGGAVPDHYGDMLQFAGASGYSEICTPRNAYFKMHLPILEIIVKSGLVGLFTYVFTLKRMFNISDAESILLTISILLVFYVNKEFMLFTIMLANLLNHTENNRSIKTNA